MPSVLDNPGFSLSPAGDKWRDLLCCPSSAGLREKDISLGRLIWRRTWRSLRICPMFSHSQRMFKIFIQKKKKKRSDLETDSTNSTATNNEEASFLSRHFVWCFNLSSEFTFGEIRCVSFLFSHAFASFWIFSLSEKKTSAVNSGVALQISPDAIRHLGRLIWTQDAFLPSPCHWVHVKKRNQMRTSIKYLSVHFPVLFRFFPAEAKQFPIFKNNKLLV